MYLLHTTRRTDGKVHTYWQLVRSVRVGKRVRHQTVAHLGELDPQGRVRARALAAAFTGGGAQADLFDALAPLDEAVPVRLDRMRLERGRTFGDVWLGWTVWRALQLDGLLECLLPPGREAIPWATMAAVLVLARLCEPASELHLAEIWYRQTALEDLLGVPAALVNDDRCSRALDQLLPHKAALESHLVTRFGELFQVDYDLLLYDVTSTYFEGHAVANPLAQRGYSRDHRPDCKQVCLALVVTRAGLPLGYEVFPGNRTDVTTVKEIVTAMEARFGVAQRIWVMDRGMVSATNLTWLQQTGRRYVVGTPKSELRKRARVLTEAQDWATVREGVEAKTCPGPDGTETFVLVRSVERREKEQAIHARFITRIETGLGRIVTRLARARRPVDRGRLERQLGRLLGRNTRAAGRYVVDLVPDAAVPAGLRLAWTARPEWDDWRGGARAATSSGPTSRTGAPRPSGRPTCSSPMPRRPSGSRRASWRSGPSGTSGPIAFRRTSWSASWPTSCGRPWSSGSSGPAWGTVRARSWPNSTASRAPTWCSPPRTAVTSACGVWCARIRPKRRSWIGSAWSCRSGSASGRT